jgi:tetratricopeptide (TPR) repeat protein
MEWVRDRYGDPHEIEDDEDELTWTYRDPEHPDDTMLLVVFENGRLVQILQAVDRVLSQRYPPLDDAQRAASQAAGELLARAGELARVGDRGAALQCLRRAVETAPADVEARYWLGVGLIEDNQFARAAEFLEATVRDDPWHLAARWRLGLAALNAGQPQKARDACRQLLARSPDSPFHERARQLLRLAEHALAGKDTRELFAGGQPAPPARPTAEELLRTALREDSQERLFRLVRDHPDGFGDPFLEECRKFSAGLPADDRRDAFRFVLGTKLNELGRALKAVGNGQAAEGVFRLLLEIVGQKNTANLQGAAWGNLGNLLRNRGALEEAQKAFVRAGELCRQAGEQEQALFCRMNAALIPMVSGRLAEARQQLSAVLEEMRQAGASVGLIRTANNLGDVCLGMRDWQAAADYAKTALEANQDRAEPEDYRKSVELLAASRFFQGRFREGMALLQSIPSVPARVQVAVAIALDAVQMERYELALTLAEAALEISPEKNPHIFWALGMAYMNLGQAERAEQCFLEVHALAVDRQDTRLERGVVGQLAALYTHPGYGLVEKGADAWSQALARYDKILEQISGGADPALLVLVLHNLGFLWHYIGKLAKTVAERAAAHTDWPGYFEQSIRITRRCRDAARERRDLEGEALAENQLAMNAIELGRWDEATSHLDRAEELSASFQLSKAESTKGRMLYNRARIARARGDHDRAWDCYRRCVAQVELLRRAAQSDPFLISIWEEWQGLFEELVTYGLGLNRKAEALYYLESVKARAFLDLLTRRPVPPDFGDGIEGEAPAEAAGRIQSLERSLEMVRGDPAQSGLARRLEGELAQARQQQRWLTLGPGRRLPDRWAAQVTQPLHYTEVVEILKSR